MQCGIKLVTKCIVHILKAILLDLTSPLQSNFVPRRQIGDNIVIMQEIMHSMRFKEGKKGWMDIKIDLEKTYDKLKWSFLQETLEDMQLPHRLIQVNM